MNIVFFLQSSYLSIYSFTFNISNNFSPPWSIFWKHAFHVSLMVHVMTVPWFIWAFVLVTKVVSSVLLLEIMLQHPWTQKMNGPWISLSSTSLIFYPSIFLQPISISPLLACAVGDHYNVQYGGCHLCQQEFFLRVSTRNLNQNFRENTLIWSQ